MVPPVPIPNTVVKHINAESTWLETAWEDKKLPVKRGYCKVASFFAAKQKLFQAIKSAIRYCRDNELMKEYFKEHEREVLNMVTFKWDDKRAGK